MSRFDVRRITRLLPIIGLLAVACGGAQASRVAVERDQTDIVFGFSTPTPGPSAAPQRSRAPSDGGSGGPAPFTPHPFKTFEPPPSSDCPKARDDAPISEPAGTEIKGRPEAGTYRWLGSGTFDIGGANIPVPNQPQHHIRNVANYTDPVGEGEAAEGFTFETIEPRVGPSTNGYWLFRWQLKANSTSSDAEGGLVLKGIDVLGPDGKFAETYFEAFANGLLFAQLPVTPGRSWTSASLDLGNRTLQLDAQYVGREVIDVCGTVVEGWHVHATFSNGAEVATLDYLLGPQYGGQIIGFAIKDTFLGTTYPQAKFDINQLDPDPLAAVFR